MHSTIAAIAQVILDADMTRFSSTARSGSSRICTQTGAHAHHGTPGLRRLPAAMAATGPRPGRVFRVLRREAIRLLFVSAFVSLAACTPGARTRPGYSPLILISIDGYRADYLERGRSPTLVALAAGGVRAESLRPAFPTLTFPNHYTIVTGLYPDHHGIVNNRMVDPVSGKAFVYTDPKSIADPAWWGSDPLWVSVERQAR